MKWISLSLILLISPAAQSISLDCQQAGKLLQSLRAEKRSGYSVKRANKLACLEREARLFIRQICNKPKTKKSDKMTFRKQIAQACSQS